MSIVDARCRLKSLLPHLEIAAEMAMIKVPEGSLYLSVMSKRPDGTGHVAASFELKPFVDDLLLVLGYNSIDEFLAEDDNERDNNV